METGSLPIKLRPANLRPIAFRIFSKKHGLNINTEALGVLTEVISYKFGTDWKSIRSQQYLEEIAKIWKIEDRGLFIDSNGLKQIIKELNSKKDNELDGGSKAHRTDTIVDTVDDGEDAPEEELLNDDDIDWRDYFKVISAKNQPKSVFDPSRKQFDIIYQSDNSLLSKLQDSLPAKVNSYYNRYSLIRDRLSRNENFQKTSAISISALNSIKSGIKQSHEISLIKNMLGRDGQKFLLFGLLCKNNNGEFILEDETDYIELNLNQTFKSLGCFHCLGMYFLVEGIYSASGSSTSNQDSNYMGGCFYVSNIGHPPSERRDKSLDYYGNLDFLGIHKQFSTLTGEKSIKISKKYRKLLIEKESKFPFQKIIFVSGNISIIDKLNKFFNKIENSIIESDDHSPIAIVFTNTTTTTTSTTISLTIGKEFHKQNFDKLYPNIFTKLKIVLLTGDLILNGTISLDSINFAQKVKYPNTSISSNPTTLAYLSQEVIIIKDQFMLKLRKNDLNFGTIEDINKDQILSSKTKQARKLVKTLLDQGYLGINNGLNMVNLQYDHCFRLEPAPNMVVLHDESFPQFDVTYNGCKVVNIASNQDNNQFNYMEYYPATKNCIFKEI